MPIEGATLPGPTGPLGEMLRAGLEAYPDAVALVSSERALTWRELDEARLRLAAGYRALGLAPGDRLASLMPNRIDLAVHYLACFTAGLVATPLNYRYTSTEIDHALEVSAAAALAHIQPSVSCVCVTPFAGPVLPDVKKIAAGAARSAGVAGPGRTAARSSKRGPPGPAPSYQASPHGRRPANALAATSGARSAWTSSAAAPDTSRAWSISVLV